MKRDSNQSHSDLPKISAPAGRALAAAGVSQLRDLTKFSEQEVRQWHGIGPKALDQLREALKRQGLSFK